MNKAACRSTRTSQVLIADDEQDIRWTLKQLIMDEGYGVIEADNGESALRVLKDSQVDIVLLDLTMPCLSGIEVLQQIKALSYTDAGDRGHWLRFRRGGNRSRAMSAPLAF